MTKILFPMIAVLLTLVLPARAEDKKDEPVYEKPNFKYKTVTTPEGLTFRVPEDMPIENRGGILAPIPFDEYAYGKFAQLYARIDKLEARLEAAEKILLRIAEAAGRSSGNAAAAPAAEAKESSSVLLR